MAREGVTRHRFMIEGHHTDGRLALVEHRFEPDALAAPMHRHHLEDEFTYVLLASRRPASMTGVSAAEPSTTGRRTTRQRTAVSAVLDEIEEFRSSQEIHDLLRRRGDSIGLTTVYRALQALADDGEVDALRREDGETVYRRCSTGHHHHLVCRVCGLTVEVAGPAVERWTERTAEEHGFTGVDHTVELFGLCPRCARARS